MDTCLLRRRVLSRSEPSSSSLFRRDGIGAFHRFCLGVRLDDALCRILSRHAVIVNFVKFGSMFPLYAVDVRASEDPRDRALSDWHGNCSASTDRRLPLLLALPAL